MGRKPKSSATQPGATTCLLVLGMHRSGTSLLARIANLAGFDLPRDLIGATADNPHGHWEPVKLNDLNDAFLRRIGSRWDDWGALALQQVPAEALRPYQAGLRRFAAREAAGKATLLLKEPRACRLAPVILAALAAEGLDTRVLIPFRNAMEVAGSLQRRDGIPTRQGLLIWLRHCLDAERHSRGLRRSFVAYDAVLRDWRGAFARIAGDLGIVWPRPLDQAGPDIDAFIDRQARHHLWDDADLDGMDFTRDLVARTQSALHRLAADPGDAEAMSALDDIGARLATIEALVLTDQRATEADRDAARSALGSLRDDHAALQGRLAEADRNVAAIRDLHESVARLNARNELYVTDLRSQLEESGRVAAARGRALEDAHAALADANRRAEQAELGRDRAATQLAATEAARAGLEAARDRLDAARSAAEARGAALEATLAGESAARQAAEAAARQAAIDAAREKDGLLDLLARYERDARAVYDSTSWRITWPLRYAGARTARLRSGLGRGAQAAWHRLPMADGAKQRLKGAVFRRAAPLLRRTGAWQAWSAAQPSPAALAAGPPAGVPAVSAADGRIRIPDDPRAFVADRILTDLHAPLARLIAFYLPQFHAIPENDEWWGKGFTEWSNVRPAQPMFPGHYQPHEPLDALGYYDLTDPSVQHRQIALARRHGVGGFCFYWYWFGGRRLLERPVERWLADPSLDFPFCICWANENWSRRWDGLDRELLMTQKHSPEDDIAFIAALAPYLRDPRYIRVEGRPLVLVYRPSLLPAAAETARRWRDWCRANDIGEIHLAYTQSFESADPADYGFDSAVEFPPNNAAPPNLTDRIEGLDPEFGGIVYDWRHYPARSRAYPPVPYRLFRSVCPGWDNTARRKKNGAIFAFSNPADYRGWLENAVEDTLERARDDSARLVFVNAWNEWAEGAHLEPDRKYGHAYLEATRDALDPAARPRHILLAGHDAHPHGAQLLLLNLARAWAARGIAVTVVLLDGGPLLAEYQAIARVTLLPPGAPGRDGTAALLRGLRDERGQVAVVNTTVAGALAGDLKAAGFRTVHLIHEMASVLRDMGLDGAAAAIARHADATVFAAQMVRRDFEAAAGAPARGPVIRPQGLYLTRTGDAAEQAQSRADVRARLGLPEGAVLVLGVGYVDQRKGVDLFVEVLAAMRAEGVDARGLWAGHWHDPTRAEVLRLAAARGVADALSLPGRVADPRGLYDAADVFLLTSREDPYPSVVLEALDAGLPVVLFAGATGCEDLAGPGAVRAVPAGDTRAMAAAACALARDPAARAAMASAGRQVLAAQGGLAGYAYDLMEIAGRPVPRVSVIVPSYNYGRYIRARLDTILAQDFPVFEIIVLDDCSTDDSIARIEEVRAESALPIRLVRNAVNAGNVFAQWRAGIEMARGDFIWIAEADDLSEPDFLSTVMRGFDHPATVISYCDSAQVGSAGQRLADSYRYYTDDIDREKWRENYLNGGMDEIAGALYLKNTIPNVSGAVMRAAPLREVFRDHGEEIARHRLAGDWVCYLHLLERGDVAFFASPKNLHRRHDGSVTLKGFGEAQLDEIARVQDWAITRHALGAVQRAAAQGYLDRLARQFGLAERAGAAE